MKRCRSPGHRKWRRLGEEYRPRAGQHQGRGYKTSMCGSSALHCMLVSCQQVTQAMSLSYWLIWCTSSGPVRIMKGQHGQRMMQPTDVKLQRQDTRNGLKSTHRCTLSVSQERLGRLPAVIVVLVRPTRRRTATCRLMMTQTCQSEYEQ